MLGLKHKCEVTAITQVTIIQEGHSADGNKNPTLGTI